MEEVKNLLQHKKNLIDGEAKTGSSKTKNEFLEKNGYLVIKDLWDPDELYHPVPTERGLLLYDGKTDKYEKDERRS